MIWTFPVRTTLFWLHGINATSSSLSVRFDLEINLLWSCCFFCPQTQEVQKFISTLQGCTDIFLTELTNISTDRHLTVFLT